MNNLGNSTLARPQRLLVLLLTACFCLPSWSLPNSAPLPSSLQLKPTDQGVWIDGLKALAIGSMALVAATASLLWLRRNYAGNIQTNSSMQLPVLKSSRRVSQKTLLLVVHWEGKHYLLSESNGVILVVDSRPVAEESS